MIHFIQTLVNKGSKSESVKSYIVKSDSLDHFKSVVDNIGSDKEELVSISCLDDVDVVIANKGETCNVYKLEVSYNCKNCEATHERTYLIFADSLKSVVEEFHLMEDEVGIVSGELYGEGYTFLK